MSNGPYIVDETCLVFAKNIEEENGRLREENENLRKALKPLASLAKDVDPQEPNHLVGTFISSQAILAANKILQGDE